MSQVSRLSCISSTLTCSTQSPSLIITQFTLQRWWPRCSLYAPLTATCAGIA